MLKGLSAKRLGNTFANFDLSRNPGMRDAYARCHKVAIGNAASALLVGPPGTGKTHLAIAAMNRKGLERSYFWKVPDFLDWVKRLCFDQHMALEDVVKNYREGDFLLVFDDLGVENPTDWAYEQLYRVLDARYEELLPTIITSNQPLDRIDPRLLSRFRAGLVNCDGVDQR